MELALGIITGIGLSAACGFRVFVPLLGMSIAHRAGHLSLANGFEWIGSTPALVTFSTATVLEILAYYIPWVDNLLDTAATPAAVVAGIIATASQCGDVSPWLQWSLAIIAGGGVSAIVQGGTVATRAVSTATTGGLGNFAISTLEGMASLLVVVLAIVVPVVCLVLVVGLGARMIHKRLRVNATAPAHPGEDA